MIMRHTHSSPIHGTLKEVSGLKIRWAATVINIRLYGNWNNCMVRPRDLGGHVTTRPTAVMNAAMAENKGAH